jgi:uncharacterized cupredoxin-like copper-binding protein
VSAADRRSGRAIEKHISPALVSPATSRGVRSAGSREVATIDVPGASAAAWNVRETMGPEIPLDRLQRAAARGARAREASDEKARMYACAYAARVRSGNKNVSVQVGQGPASGWRTVLCGAG